MELIFIKYWVSVSYYLKCPCIFSMLTHSLSIFLLCLVIYNFTEEFIFISGVFVFLSILYLFTCGYIVWASSPIPGLHILSLHITRYFCTCATHKMDFMWIRIDQIDDCHWGMETETILTLRLKMKLNFTKYI
jgi:hypothetical protein